MGFALVATCGKDLEVCGFIGNIKRVYKEYYFLLFKYLLILAIINIQPIINTLGAEETLLLQLAKEESIRRAWDLLRKDNEESYGLSGQTIKEFSEDLDSNLEKICNDLKNNSYKFSPTRAAVIKKDNGSYRPLQIPEIKDRVVLKAIAILLEENLNEILAKSDGVSFAYQKGKGVRDAVLKIKSSYLKGGKVILKVDIINFFEEVQKDKLLKELVYPNLKDHSIDDLIRSSISQKLGGIPKKHKELFKNVGKGIPQGNPLSPLLSNIYLSGFDTYLKEAGYVLIRYADDFVVICNSEKEAVSTYKTIKKYLDEKLSLEIHPLGANNGKTEIINPCEKEFSFLSIKFDGKDIYPSKESLGFLKSHIKNIIKTGELDSTLYQEIYEAIKKWMAPYSYSDIERYFDKIDLYVVGRLNKQFGKKSHSIRKCKRLVREVRINQYNKSKNSFWRNIELIKILPRFFRKKVKK